MGIGKSIDLFSVPLPALDQTELNETRLKKRFFWNKKRGNVVVHTRSMAGTAFVFADMDALLTTVVSFYGWSVALAKTLRPDT